MKRLVTLVLFFTISTGFAQGYPQTEGASSSITETADRITDAYDQKLSMTSQQKAIFKIRVEDFLKIRQKIMASKTGKDQLNALVNLQAEETLAMNDVLTRLQMSVYKKVKREIQPLKVVDMPNNASKSKKKKKE
jgi:hypothetical protein